MDYPAFGIPMNTWTLINQLQDRYYVDVDSNSVGSSSPPPSPLSPSPSLLSNEDESTFHFLPVLGPMSAAVGNKKSGGSVLSREVSALLGLNGPTNKTSPLKHSPTGFNNGGFYKRLLEWLSRKKKSRRRFSEFPLPDGCDVDTDLGESHHFKVAYPPTCNRSAPAIFDFHRSSRVKHSHVEDQLENPAVSSQTSVDHLVDPKSLGSDVLVDDDTSPQQVTIKQDGEETIAEVDAEWAIHWDDIEIGEAIGRGSSCTINRGKWHGDVMIHRFHLKNAGEMTEFWSNVRSLSKLRHENLLLFMGVATDSPTYTIVNSAPRGVSVADFRLAVKNGKPERIGIQAAVSICRQVAQATGYLHARGIVHGKLNPHNIFLEGDNYRVKLSLLDHGLVDTVGFKNNCGCIPKTQIGYYSPELIRSIVVQPPEIRFTTKSTRFSDVYAFGSFIYDIISGYPPYNQEEIDSVFWRIGSGYTVSLQDINCNTRLKTVITACWSPNPTERPSFVEVLRRLQPSALLCRSHSCSEPERLNRLGMCRLTC